MHILNKSNRLAVAPEFLWRDQTRERIARLLAQGRARFNPITRADWLALKAEWREMIRRVAVDVTKARKDPLHATLLSENAYDGFRVQNIVFESLPGWQVGLNLFLPLGETDPARWSPILCPCGHGPKWQDDHQIPPQVLARNGFAAALFDPPMFGEKARHNDHFIQGPQAGMVGLWSGMFFLADAIRVADYLQTRRDIDFSNGLGVTGVSGGGITTLLLAQLDDRVKVIAPVCCVAPFQAYLSEGFYTGCREAYVFGQASRGMDFHSLLFLAADRPCLVIGGKRDAMFRPEHMESAVHQAKLIYELEGVPERLALFFDDCPHKYNSRMAVETAKWMRRWLHNDSTWIECDHVPLIPVNQLNCGTAESSASMLQFVQSEAGRLKKSRRVDVSNQTLANLFHLTSDPPASEVEAISPPTPWGYKDLTRKVLHTREDLPLPVIELEAPSAPEGTILCFTDADKIEPLKQAGGFFGLRRRIIAADLRGFGELKPEPSDYDVYAWCSIDRAISDLLFLCGDCPMAQQIQDALRVIDAVGGEITVYARGEAALPALLAALLRPEVRRIVLESFLCSFESLAVAPSPSWYRYQYVPDVLRYFDLPEVLAQRGDKQFLLINPCDAVKLVLDDAAARQLYGSQAHVTTRINPDPASVARVVQEWLNRTTDA